MNLLKLAEQAWFEVRSSYVAWASVTLLNAFIHYLFFTLPLNWLLGNSALKGTLMGLMITSLMAPLITENILFFFANKYFLTLSRNPRIVKRHFFASIKYSLMDGAKKRLRFSLLLLVTMGSACITLAALYILPFYALGGGSFTTVQPASTQLFGAPLFIIAIVALAFILTCLVINANVFLVAYIAQDTLSADNQLPALTFRSTVKKSIQLMRGQKRIYFGLLCSTLLATLIFIFMTGKLQALAFLTTYSTLLQQGLYLVATIIRIATIDVFTIALKTVWADSLLVEDATIVDYGDTTISTDTCKVSHTVETQPPLVNPVLLTEDHQVA